MTPELSRMSVDARCLSWGQAQTALSHVSGVSQNMVLQIETRLLAPLDIVMTT